MTSSRGRPLGQLGSRRTVRSLLLARPQSGGRLRWRSGGVLTAIEVKSGRPPDSLPGMAAFAEAFHPTRKLLVGAGGITVEGFLSRPVEHWVRE